MKKHDWIKYRFHGGKAAVWHLPDDESHGSVIRPACKSNGPISGKIEAVQSAEILPQGQVCAACARLFLNRLKLNLEDSVRKELIKRKLDATVNIDIAEVKEETICPNVRIVRKP